MRDLFCKKSVFGILFLVFFSLGTICGVLLFWYFSETHPHWIVSYCSALSKAASPGILLQIFFALCPLLAVAALGLLPGGNRLLLLLILFRGCFLAYSAAAFYTGGQPFGSLLLRELFLMPVFYGLCDRFYRRPWNCKVL